MTQVVARRVAALRKAAGLNQAELGERMAAMRPGWSRSTVVKLENLNRESLSISDLAALALALDVPPIWLLADPKSTDPVPVAPGVELEPWSALLWWCGRRAAGPTGERWKGVAEQIRAALQVIEAVEAVELSQVIARMDALTPATSGEEAERRERRVQTDLERLGFLVHLLDQFKNWGVPPPPVSDQVRQRARDLGVELLGQEG